MVALFSREVRIFRQNMKLKSLLIYFLATQNSVAPMPDKGYSLKASGQDEESLDYGSVEIWSL